MRPLRRTGGNRRRLSVVSLTLPLLASLAIPVLTAKQAQATQWVEPPTPAPAWTATVHEYPLPVDPSSTFTQVGAITTGPDGNLWAIQDMAFGGPRLVANQITTSGVVSQYDDPTVPTGNSLGIASGPGASLWYTVSPGCKAAGCSTGYTAPRIGSVSTSGTFSSFAMPTTVTNPATIVSGPDGNLWFIDGNSSSVDMMTPAGQVTRYPTSAPGWDITVGADGNLWFTEPYPQNNKIARITTAGTLTEFPVPAAVGSPVGITAGPDGALWFTGANVIGRITTAGAISFFSVATSSKGAAWITSGSDGNLWFPEPDLGRMGRLNPATGAFAEFRLPNFHGAERITAGPDGKLWFTENIACGAASGGGYCPMVASLDPATATPPPPPCLTVTSSVVLTADLGPCAGDGIDIAASNITVNLNGHRVFAATGPRYGDFAGIRFESVSGATVTGGEVTGFDAGVLLDHGASNRVSQLNLHDNFGSLNSYASLLGDGIVAMHSANNVISNNTVNHNGIFDGIGLLGVGSNGNTIQGNVIENNNGEGADDGSGIVANPFLELNNPDRGSSLTGNNMLGNTVTANTGHGISDPSNTYSTIQGNTVSNNGLSGIGVSNLRFATSSTHDVVESNRSTGNGFDGINVASRDNKIVDNVTDANGRWDLDDAYSFDHKSGGCYNYWNGNTWGSGGYSPACVTVGGTGPNPPASAASPMTPSTSTGNVAQFSRGRALPS